MQNQASLTHHLSFSGVSEIPFSSFRGDRLLFFRFLLFDSSMSSSVSQEAGEVRRLAGLTCCVQ
jgi:hypothetical protein